MSDRSSADTSAKKSQPGRITAFLDRLSTSNLVFVVAAIFAVDLVVPDAVPLIDEVILGVLTILLARWRANAQARARGETGANSGRSGGTEGGGTKPPPKNVTPS